jgi:hypothetical protein
MHNAPGQWHWAQVEKFEFKHDYVSWRTAGLTGSIDDMQVQTGLLQPLKWLSPGNVTRQLKWLKSPVKVTGQLKWLQIGS